MTLTNLKICVVGAGIGGLAVARALAMRGADVTVLEQAVEIAEVGAGLQISPNGFAVLKALGLEEALRDVAVQGQAVSLRDYRKGPVLNLDLRQLENQNYYFLHRADLIDLLAASVRLAGVKIRLLQKVERIIPGNKPKVILASGAEIETDIVIGADGLHSKLRSEINGTSDPVFTGQVAWRAIVPNVDNRGPQAHVHMGPHRHVVSYPVRGGRDLNIVAVQARAAWVEESWSLRDDPLEGRASFWYFGPEVRGMLNRIEDVHLWGLFRHPVARVWHRQNTVLLGDAAHPSLPFLAQGAAMALEDAWILANSLSTERTISQAFIRYQDLREARVRRVVKAANGNARKYHLAARPVRWVAHSALRIGGAIAPKRMMQQFNWLYGHDVTRDS